MGRSTLIASILVTVLVVGCASGTDDASSVSRNDGPTPPTPSGAPPAAAVSCEQSKTIRVDATLSYTLCYPAGWQPSGNRYANAFEIRKQINRAEGGGRGSVPLVSTHTANDDAAAADRFLDGLLRQANALRPSQRRLTVSGYRAVRVERSMAEAVLGHGAAASGTASSSGPTETLRFLGLYAAAGRYVIAVEASVPADADASILNEVREIQRQLRVTPASSP